MLGIRRRGMGESNSLYGRNIFYELSESEGYIHDDGITITENDWHWIYSDFIPIKEGDVIQFALYGYTTVSSITLYNGNKQTILTNAAPENQTLFKGECKVPKGAKYLRMCGNSESYAGGKKDNQFVIISKH